MCERLEGRTQTLRALMVGRRCGGSARMRSSPKECTCAHTTCGKPHLQWVYARISRNVSTAAKAEHVLAHCTRYHRPSAKVSCSAAGVTRREPRALKLKLHTACSYLCYTFTWDRKKIEELPFLTSDKRPQNKLPRYRQVGSLFALSLPPLSRRTALQTLRSAAARPRRADGRSVSPRPAGGRCPKRRDKLFDKCLLFVESCRRYIAINA